MQYDFILTNYYTSAMTPFPNKIISQGATGGGELGLPHSFGKHNSIHNSWLSGFQLLEFRDPDPRMRKLLVDFY